MSVRIDLDNPPNGVFTCLDFVSGKVVMNLPTDDNVSSVTVKMEGISRTRLEHPRFDMPGERPREKRKAAELEIHRVLYIVQTVFPSEGVRENVTSTTGFTLKAGQYEYPFKIRIPINASCTDGALSSGIGGGLLQKVNFDMTKGTVDYAKEATRHVKGTLPPSLSGIPDDTATIRYFLKVTVNRPKFYKTNLRHHDPFVFLPIEPPRSPPDTLESYARKKHEFITVHAGQTKAGFFSALRKPDPASLAAATPVRFSFEARLPSPPIVVPGEPLGLRLLLTKTEPFREVIFMRSLQITLLTTTHITAHELVKDEFSSVLLLSIADIRVPFGDENSMPNVGLEADANMWRGRTLPDTVSPTFTTCNISRTYSLQIDIGLSVMSRAGNEHVDILSLNCLIQVYSGIKPSQQLIDTLSDIPPPQPPRTIPKPIKTDANLHVPNEKANYKGFGSYSAAPSPTTESTPVLPERPHTSHATTPYNAADYTDEPTDSLPPPTYEDAVAEGIAPVDGPRRRYQQEGAYYQALPEDSTH